MRSALSPAPVLHPSTSTGLRLVPQLSHCAISPGSGPSPQLYILILVGTQDPQQM